MTQLKTDSKVFFSILKYLDIIEKSEYLVNEHDYRGTEEFSLSLNDYTKTCWIQRYDEKYYKIHYYHVLDVIRKNKIIEILK